MDWCFWFGKLAREEAIGNPKHDADVLSCVVKNFEVGEDSKLDIQRLPVLVAVVHLVSAEFKRYRRTAGGLVPGNSFPRIKHIQCHVNYS